MLRIVIAVISVILAYTMAWFIVLPFVFFVIILKPSWIELLLVGIIIDSLYAPPMYFGLHYPITTLSIIVMISSLYIRKFVRA